MKKKHVPLFWFTFLASLVFIDLGCLFLSLALHTNYWLVLGAVDCLVIGGIELVDSLRRL